MNLTSSKEIKELLSKYQAKPSKIMGQNFLVDQKVLSTIIEAAELTKKDTVVEIGPGIGALTKELAQKAGKVIAIEKDVVMEEITKETLKDFKNIEIIHGDIRFPDSRFKIPDSNYKVVANIPYYLTSPLIRNFLESKNQPEYMVLMVQKEVAQRICATPPRLSLLAVSVQFYSSPKIISPVSRQCFWPAPKVDSAIVKITPHTENSNINRDLFFTIVKAGFSHPRKQLANNLSTSLKKERVEISQWLAKNNIKPEQRAETLDIKDWINLVTSL